MAIQNLTGLSAAWCFANIGGSFNLLRPVQQALQLQQTLSLGLRAALLLCPIGNTINLLLQVQQALQPQEALSLVQQVLHP